MNPDIYVQALDLPVPGIDVAHGGQELILGEIVASIPSRASRVWVPFPDGCETLVGTLKALGYDVITDRATEAPYTTPIADVVYFGTPTIVGGVPLFDQDEEWTAEKERYTVRDIVTRCEAAGYERIVCGLGSGDVSLTDRFHDLGGGDVVAWKQFDGFVDYVIVRDR